MTYGTMTDQPIAFDAAFFTDPYPTYARLPLRELAPLHQVIGLQQAPVWLITQYAEVPTTLADPRLSAR